MTAISSSVFDLVDRIATASTVHGVWDAYLGATGDLGLKFGIVCHMPRSENRAIQLLADALPKGWLEEYRAQQLSAGDLLIERILQSSTSFEWAIDDWDIGALTPIQQRWRDHNLHRGIRSGFCILDFRRGDDMLLVVCGAHEKLAPHDRLALNFTGQEAMGRIRELAIAVPAEFTTLSRRERECLQWAAIGKTDWEIGQILSLSEKTVNVYIERAKSKFGVNTRAQAVVRALRDGLIAA